MSTVARKIQEELKSKSGISSAILNLSDFYVPIRGNMRRKNRSRANSMNVEESKQAIEQEIEIINEQVDFDDPKQIDYELLIVSRLCLAFELANLFSERTNDAQGTTHAI